MCYIFVNCIAAGPVDWKHSLTATGQPDIKDCFMIVAEGFDPTSGDIISPHILDELPAANAYNLEKYSTAIGNGAVVVGHSVDYHHGHLRATMLKFGIDPHDGNVNTICTMLGLAGYVTKRNGRLGWPTFDEACEHFGITRSGQESAEDNARCLMQVFMGMQKLRDVPVRTLAKIWKERTQK